MELVREKRYEVLDGLRGVAAIGVMLMHYSENTGHRLFTHADIAVDLFFILSGFVLMHSYRSKLLLGLSAREYVKKRIIRLYPMFAISMAIGIPALIAAALIGLANYPLRSIIVASLDNLLFLPYLGDHGVANMVSTAAHLPVEKYTVGEIFPANPSAWSLFFEMVASIALLVLIRLQRRDLIKLIIVSAILLFGTGVLLGVENKNAIPVFFGAGWGTRNFFAGFIRVAYGFSMGVLIYSLHETQTPLKFGKVLSVIVRSDIALYLLFAIAIAFPFGIKGLYPMAVIFFVAPLMVYCGANLQPTGRVGARLAHFLGWLSYPIYCLHSPIGRLVFMYFPGSEHRPGQAIALSVALTIAISVIATRLLEEPVRAYLTRKFSSRKRAGLKAEPVV
ncbi:acyltransferase family protein [Paraburkholderia rhizosphaerae]|uniref:Peptidoglycan/LPS O-acetylase OafA/YrhL n=1 Tax=Paraburkholderia rhizosphaerae TaxID=480658 RepID=A0A4R8M081_9BURK|nr:acyltransferase [Paraburkholderia rhizosphaerae]TDY54655.1 peptidoglycan/LPS O-acetylase OafA/YrhL [Paraburkholderia rhizosphaerae]